MLSTKPHPFDSLIEHITQRPLTQADLACPKCGWKHLKLEQVFTTLLGFTGSVNPNHIWWAARCNNCQDVVKVESKGLNYWIVQDGVVLAGLPSCFENYKLTCATCKGPVHREHTDIDGETPVSSLYISIEDGRAVKKYRTFWLCQGACKWRLETDDDHWRI